MNTIPLDALEYVFVHMKNDKRIPLAEIYKGHLLSKIGDYYRANKIFRELRKKDLKTKYAKLLAMYDVENLIAFDKKEEAIDVLTEAYQLNKGNEIRSRIAFLRGQLLLSLGKNQEARESFVTAYQKSNNFEFEVKSQIEISKTFNRKEDYEGAKQYLEKISRKGTYASRKNEFYYALGLMAEQLGKEKEANDFFNKALKEKISDPQVRGLTFFEIAKKLLTKKDYLGAGLYYDSAAVVMTYEPMKKEVLDLSSRIKKISKNYYIVQKNDSILNLAHMNNEQRLAYFQNYIQKLKIKEEKETEIEEEKRKKEKKNHFFQREFSLDNSNQGFLDFEKSKDFYFYSQTAVAKGASQFKQIWGDRALVDDWRYSHQISGLEEMKNEAMGVKDVKNPQRFEIQFYIDQIPTDKKVLSQLKKARDSASLELGMMYQNLFQYTALATNTLMNLVKNNPEESVKLNALYEIFSMNYEKNNDEAQQAKKMIINEFPYSPYAYFVQNPKRQVSLSSNIEVEKLYQQALELYEDGKYEQSRVLIEKTKKDYPKDYLIPKFTLLDAFNSGKLFGREMMILQLEQIALNYEKNPEGEKAKQMLKYLKGEKEIKSSPSKEDEKQSNEFVAVENNNHPIVEQKEIEKNAKDSFNKTKKEKEGSKRRLRRVEDNVTGVGAPPSGD